MDDEIWISSHRVYYWYDEDWDGSIGDADIEHIENCIKDGIIEGELATSDPKNPDVTHYGWWRITK